MDAVSKPVDNINARIAARVRGLRAGLGLSLDALAQKSGVSRSMISLIERGESSPTAVVLEKLAGGLGATLAALFNDPASPPSPISRAADRRPWRDPATGYLRCNLSPSGHPSPLDLVEVIMPPRTRVAYESGVRDVAIHQQVWILEGVLEVTVGPALHRLAAGDCLAMQLNAPTAFHNRARKRARYLVALAGGRARTPLTYHA